jgi:MFS family permease
MNLMPIFLQDIGRMTMTQIGWMNSVFGISMMAMTIPGGWLSDKTNERTVIAIGMVLVGASLFILVGAPSGLVWIYFAGWALAGLGVGMMTPAYQSLISKAVPAELRGTAFGLFSTSLGIISLPAPWIGAQLWAGVGPRFPFMITGLVAMFTIIPIMLKLRLPAKAQEES